MTLDDAFDKWENQPWVGLSAIESISEVDKRRAFWNWRRNYGVITVGNRRNFVDLRDFSPSKNLEISVSTFDTKDSKDLEVDNPNLPYTISEYFKLKEIFHENARFMITREGIRQLRSRFNKNKEYKDTRAAVLTLLSNPQLKNDLDYVIYWWLQETTKDKSLIKGKIKAGFKTIDSLTDVISGYGITNPFAKHVNEIEREATLKDADAIYAIQRIIGRTDLNETLSLKKSMRFGKIMGLSLKYYLGSDTITVKLPFTLENLMDITGEHFDFREKDEEGKSILARRLQTELIRKLSDEIEIEEGTGNINTSYRRIRRFIGYYDFLSGLVSRALYYNYLGVPVCLPEPDLTSKDFPMSAKNLRHPLYFSEDLFRHQPFVSNDYLHDKKHLVITGPNEAGKSVYAMLFANLFVANTGSAIFGEDFHFNPKTQIHFPFPEYVSGHGVSSFRETLLKVQGYVNKNIIHADDIMIIEDIGGGTLPEGYSYMLYSILERGTSGSSKLIIAHNLVLINDLEQAPLDSVCLLHPEVKNNEPTYKIVKGAPDRTQYLMEVQKIVEGGISPTKF